MKINKDTNLDPHVRETILKEARMSKNRARVALLRNIQAQRTEHLSMETAYGYDPVNDMSFTGEFEAIGA